MGRPPVHALAFVLILHHQVPIAAAQPGDTGVGADPSTPALEVPAAAEAEVETPDVPDSADPLLTEIPRPAKTLKTWQQALRLVRTRSTALKISQAQIDQARGQERQALAGALPSLTGSANVQRHLLFGTGLNFGAQGVTPNARIPNPATNFVAQVDLRQPVLALGTWENLGAARLQTRKAELTAKDTERQLLAGVATGVVNVVTMERIADTSRVSLRSALSTLDLTKRRALLGAANAIDVLRAEQEVARSRAQVVTANENVRQARESLGLALGDPGAWGVERNLRMDELSRTAQQICDPVDNIETRSDIEAAALGVEAAERQQKSTDFRYAPTLDFLSTLTWLQNLNRSPNNEHMQWTIGGIFTWPLYDGGDREGDRRRAAAQTSMAQQELIEKKRTAKIEVIQARRSIQVAEANRKVSQQSRDIAEQSARLSRIAFVNGSGTSFDLVDTAQRLREAEIDLAIKDFQLVQARITAFLALANCGI